MSPNSIVNMPNELETTPISVARKRKSPSPTPSVSSNSNATAKKRKGSPTSETSGKSASRGLRHFSLMVCRKVEEKGTTSYNEVADELVKQVLAERRKENAEHGTKSSYDEKNIRRRVYDALNVLMAMDIISKDRKEIHWKGLPESCHRDLAALQKERDYREKQVLRKRQALQELLAQQVCFRNLVTRNQASNTTEEKIPLPFIVVNTHSNAVIQCDMNPDRTDVMFDFSMPFEINDDNTILKKMGMDKTSMGVLRQMLPEDLLDYSQHHGLLDDVVSSDGIDSRRQDSLRPPHLHHNMMAPPMASPSPLQQPQHHAHHAHHPTSHSPADAYHADTHHHIMQHHYGHGYTHSVPSSQPYPHSFLYSPPRRHAMHDMDAPRDHGARGRYNSMPMM